MEKHYNCIFRCNNPSCGCEMVLPVLEGPFNQTMACPKQGCGGTMVFLKIKM